MPKILRFLIPFVVISLFFIFFFQKSRSNIVDLSGNYDSEALLAEFMGSTVAVPQMLVDKTDDKKVLSETIGGTKRIEVDLTNQILYAFENNQVVMSFPVSTGKWGKTPTGIFHIWIKLRYTRMKGGVPGTGTYYNLPNVPYTMYFYNDETPKYRGFGLHGAYWHNNFGHPMSHGCVNISPENAGKLYNWADPVTEKNTTYATDENPGTEVIIYGTAPNN